MTLVYSTDGGRMCPQCRQPLAACRCAEAARQAVRGDGKVRVSRERAGRGGKTVTTVSDLGMAPPQLEELARELKRSLGTGGAVVMFWYGLEAR